MLRNDVLKNIKQTEGEKKYHKIRSFLLDAVISSSYGAQVSGMELKEEHVLGQTHEKLFCFDVGQLNFGYISGMVFSNISGDGGWHKSMVRAFLRAKSVWFHQVIVVCCAKMQLALQPFPSCVKTYILVQNIANRSIINTFFTVFCPTFIRERKRKEY